MSKAVRLGTQETRPIVTTAWVLTEVADAMSSPANRPAFIRLLETLKSSQDVKILPATADLFDRGVQLYAERADKEWSLTDCISFIVMADEGLADALTGDHHFEQAGFKARTSSTAQVSRFCVLDLVAQRDAADG